MPLFICRTLINRDMNNRPFYIVFLLSVLCSCSDFISKDITGDTVTTLSPVNGDTVTSYSQLFWWEEVEGAEEYHLQVVKPSFTNIQMLFLDTTIEGNKFNFSLQPGTYQWRVRAQNNAGYTPYTINTITIDSTLDLTSQTVQLISPSNNTTTQDLQNTFRWFDMPFADSYTFHVLQGSTTIHINSNITSDSISYTFPAYGTYKWRVWAQNSASNSHYMEYNITVAAGVSTPYAPADNDTIFTPVASMGWTRPTGIVADSLIIATDVFFSNVVHRSLNSATSYSFTVAPGQEYYWKLRSKTSQGTMSGYSAVYRFYAD
jgi:hypothetical protein